MAVSLGSFWGVLAATVLAFYNANAQLYRFAGPELVGPQHRRRPSLSSWPAAWRVHRPEPGERDARPAARALPAPAVTLVGVALLGLAVMSAIRFPAHVRPAPGSDTGRSVAELARQPAFVIAVAAGRSRTA